MPVCQHAQEDEMTPAPSLTSQPLTSHYPPVILLVTTSPRTASQTLIPSHFPSSLQSTFSSLLHKRPNDLSNSYPDPIQGQVRRSAVHSEASNPVPTLRTSYVQHEAAYSPTPSAQSIPKVAVSPCCARCSHCRNQGGKSEPARTGRAWRCTRLGSRHWSPASSGYVANRPCFLSSACRFGSLAS